MSSIDPRDHLLHARRPRPCLGHREREPGRLQLRVALGGDEGVCDVIVEEQDDRVEVLLLVCGERSPRDEVINCPIHVYLSRALGDRQVVDAARSGAAVELFTPDW